jgi:hypothetical protein
MAGKVSARPADRTSNRSEGCEPKDIEIGKAIVFVADVE